jgi:hypothetical protein
MTSNPRPLPLALQLELTLPASPTRTTPPTRVIPPRDDDWRLDEATRRIGRQGVAAARALLAGSDSDHGSRGDGPGTGRLEVGMDAGRAGRAA